MPEGVTVRPLTPADEAQARGLYGLSVGALDCALVRDERYWDQWVAVERRGAYVALSEGCVIVYVDVKADDRAVRLTDFAAREEHAPLLVAVMREIAKVNGMPPFALIPARFAVDQLAAGVAYPVEDSVMIRVNSPLSLRGGDIETIQQLREVVTDPVFFEVDGF